MNPGDLLDLIIRNEAHALVLGVPGTGKTTLIRLALAQRRDYPALVFDYVGNYRGFVDYYGVYPINPFEFIKPQDFTDVLGRVITVAYGYANAMSPAMEEVIITALEESALPGEDGDVYSIPHALQWLFTIGPDYFKYQDEQAALRGARRRLHELANNMLFATRTHPVLRAWLDGGLRAQVGVRLRGFSLRQILLYVTTILTIMARRVSEAIGWRLVVIDEAQYYAGAEGISPLEEAVRIGRNYGYLYIAITQDASAIPERLRGLFKVVVDFERSNTPFKALVEARVTRPELAVRAIPGRADEAPRVRDFVTVDPNALRAFVRSGVDWFDCLKRAGLVESSIVGRYVYYKACVNRGSRGCLKWVDRVRDLSSFEALWDCLAGH